MDPTSWRLAKDVIAEALRRPVAEREQFVRARCEDGALADELVSILLVGTPPRDPNAVADSAPFDPGTRIGPYIVLDRLGRGGMGEVFLGSDPRLQRKVALKCVIRSLADAGEERQRVLHEARAAARVNHPNVATIHDIVEIEDRAFIVMEYVEGESLAARMKRGPLSIASIVDIGRQLASALGAAHAKGVVHRDLKPANVQLTPEGRPKILDFGIANAPRLTMPSSTTSGTTQAVQATVRIGHPGTPPYMSPEQLLGRPLDERSDIFSLGVVLFEMTTGRRPFPGKDHLSVIVEQGRGVPRADTVNAQAPRALADVIERALRADADERQASASEVAAALGAIERGLERQAEPLSRKIARGLVAVASGVAAIGGIGVLVTAGFNNTFGRTADFARFGVEPWPNYFGWGVLAVIPSLFIMTLAAAALYAARIAWRMAATFGSANRTGTEIGRAVRRAWAAAGFDRPAGQSQALAALGIASIASVLWYFSALVFAITSLFNSSPIRQLLPLQPYSRNYYLVAVNVMILFFAYAALAVSRRLRAEQAKGGRAAITVVIAVLGVMLLMLEWPYRILNQRDFPRTVFAGQRCYVTGQTNSEYLLLCPNATPPRNRVVAQSAVKLDGVENVFNGIDR